MMSVLQPDQTRYVFEEKLGEGLNSIVWRARRYDMSGEHSRPVALKIPKDQMSVPFLRREFELLQRVNSIYCSRVIAWESFSGESALVLEWIDGVSLFHLSQTTLTLECRSELVRQIYLALLDLRAADVCHGDLHPGNIMVDRSGRIRLIDFASGRNANGTIQAAPAFISPGIWEGEDFSHSSDLFALQIVRDHLEDGFRNLPSRSMSSKPLKISKENLLAQSEIAKIVSRLLQSGAVVTQIVATSVPKRPVLPKRLVLALCSAMTVALPCFAHDPVTNVEGSAKLTVTSQNWMQVSLNGKDAGFAPLTLLKLKSGMHRVEWTTAAGRGELRLELKADRAVNLRESRGRLEVR